MARTCGACRQSLSGHYVKALGLEFHVDCFTCIDCSESVVHNFFESPDGKLLCEFDHFRRLGLLCSKCNAPLKGPFIRAKDLKFHLDHFTCSLCPLIFRQNDSYYEREGRIYCPEHYAALFASSCRGCHSSVLNNYVEVKREGASDEKEEHWHPHCYMLNKLWKVTVKSEADSSKPLGTTIHSPDKVKKILSTLSSFEEASAECISNMLIKFSNLDYVHGSAQASLFINYIESLFFSIQSMDELSNGLGSSQALSGNLQTSSLALQTREAKQLSKRIVYFLSLLSSTRESTSRDASTKEMISVVTNLAYSLKLVIRGALVWASLLEEKGHPDMTLQFINSLESGAIFPRSGQDAFIDVDQGQLCEFCKEPVEDECFAAALFKWHPKCFKCSQCKSTPVGSINTMDRREWSFDEVSRSLLCSDHVGERTVARTHHVPRLEHYNNLILIALKKLCQLLNVPYPPNVEEAFDGSDNPDDDFSARKQEMAEDEDSDGGMSPQMLDTLSRPPKTAHPSTKAQSPTYNAGSENLVYISDLTGYKVVIARQLAALSLHALFGDKFSLNELMRLAKAPKPTIWSKLVEAIRPPAKKKPVKENGVFGVALSTLVDNYGIETELGPTEIPNKRIPIIVEEAIRSLQDKDLATEGIFRKNGNVRQLKDFLEECDRDPKNIDFKDDNPVQVAATLKRFLRDLPEPLLTFKLYKVFVACHQLEASKQLEALHYVICLLPRPNLHMLQVLLWFMEEVSFHAGIDQDWGNKMDLDNLATVMAPNILLSATSATSSPGLVMENPYEAIHIVKLLFRHQHDLWRVPPSILKALSGLVDKGPSDGASSGPSPRLGHSRNDMSPDTSLNAGGGILHEDAPRCREIVRRYQLEILKSKNLEPGASVGKGHSGQKVS